MNKQEVVELLKNINVVYPSFSIPIDPDGQRRLVNGWHELLIHTPYDLASKNLKEYVLDPANKYPPHPGALAKNKSDIDRYYDHMRASGVKALDEFDAMKKTAVPPTEEQRRRVRESLGYSTRT